MTSKTPALSSSVMASFAVRSPHDIKNVRFTAVRDGGAYGEVT